MRSIFQVVNGGSGNPSPLVAFPGAYKATDPGILLSQWFTLVSIASY